jgi:nitrogen-specific signal transduction histidine kinase
VLDLAKASIAVSQRLGSMFDPLITTKPDGMGLGLAIAA